MLRCLEDPVGDVDRAAVIAGQEVRPGELPAEGDTRRVGRKIGELGCGGFEEGDGVGRPIRGVERASG